MMGGGREGEWEREALRGRAVRGGGRGRKGGRFRAIRGGRGLGVYGSRLAPSPWPRPGPNHFVYGTVRYLCVLYTP